MALLYDEAGAEFDPLRVYRYRLWRLWGASHQQRTCVLWVMLNPSTADEHVLDPTLRRVESFSRRLGYDGFEVANLFALRSTDPTGLLTHHQPVGPETDYWLRESIVGAASIIVGWGSPKTRAMTALMGSRIQQVKSLLADRSVCCLGRNQDGNPKHPLYLADSTQLVKWGSV